MVFVLIFFIWSAVARSVCHNSDFCTSPGAVSQDRTLRLSESTLGFSLEFLQNSGRKLASVKGGGKKERKKEKKGRRKVMVLNVRCAEQTRLRRPRAALTCAEAPQGSGPAAHPPGSGRVRAPAGALREPSGAEQPLPAEGSPSPARGGSARLRHLAGWGEALPAPPQGFPAKSDGAAAASQRSAAAPAQEEARCAARVPGRCRR